LWESRESGMVGLPNMLRLLTMLGDMRVKKMPRTADTILLLACAMGMSACQLGFARSNDAEIQSTTPGQQGGMVIEGESQLPDGYPHHHYEFHFHAHGALSVQHWKVEKGALPPGMKLDESGLLAGDPERPGEFQFTVSVTDGGNPESAVQKQFVLKVVAVLAINWKTPAHATGNRIDGTVEVSNTSPDDMDLTFVVVAVAGNGRATAIGYQHFVLKKGTVAMELPFGETLPHGGYVIHVDAVGEVAPKNVIYRDRMETPGPLQVTVGP
jgi:Putative Ig domain